MGHDENESVNLACHHISGEACAVPPLHDVYKHGEETRARTRGAYGAGREREGDNSRNSY